MSRTIIVKELRLKSNFENYTLLESVGQGGWGKVYKAVRQSDNKVVALKLFGYTKHPPILSSINNEIMLMKSLIGVNGLKDFFSLSLFFFLFFLISNLFLFRSCSIGIII